MGGLFLWQRGFPFTDIKDPKIDEKPPPYECSSCGYSTWSWNEAKHHICGTPQKGAKKGASREKLELFQAPGYRPQSLPERTVEELVRLTLKAQEDHPDWSKEQIVQHVAKSLDRGRIIG